ncbi:hypothetical protein MMC27_008574 [Xylographa pallens]|nr:hypothetical protein [Xylographa pallens]
MAQKPIFVATHPRACSTAFERVCSDFVLDGLYSTDSKRQVFMTRRDALNCVHEPFGDAFYYGPERLSKRFEDDEEGRKRGGFTDSTYQTILDRFEKEGAEGKRLFIKDMAYYLVPPDKKSVSIAPSLSRIERGVGTNGNEQHLTNDRTNAKSDDGKGTNQLEQSAKSSNPTVIPEAILKRFHFTFLIRHPRSSIPSYYRCTIPPLDEATGFYNFMPSEAGYDELRRLFDYLRSLGEIGPHVAGQIENKTGHKEAAEPAGKVQICVIDADDLLDRPNEIIETFCESVGMKYDPAMLVWDSEEDLRHAKQDFAKWNGFHEDALASSSLKPRQHELRANSFGGKKKKVKSKHEEDAEWHKTFGEEAAKIIRETVDANISDYEYLKQFAMKV